MEKSPLQISIINLSWKVNLFPELLSLSDSNPPKKKSIFSTSVTSGLGTRSFPSKTLFKAKTKTFHRFDRDRGPSPPSVAEWFWTVFGDLYIYT